MRVAHLSPDAPAVDFCLAAHGSSDFTGPVLGAQGAATGLSYGSVTKYLQVSASQYDVRLVAAGAKDCSASLAGLPDFTSLPALAAGGFFTIAAVGEVATGATNGFSLKAYVDDGTVPSGKGALRFVHAAPETPAVDVGTEASGTFTAIFSNVAFGAVAPAGGSIDANGYLVTAPLTGATIAARAHGSTTDALTVADVSLAAGEIATAFAIGGSTSTPAQPLKVLICDDSAAPSGLLTTCLPPAGS